MSLQPRVVTFDVFSALVDSRSGGTSAFRELADERGWNVDASQLCRRWDRANKSLQRAAADAYVPYTRLSEQALREACTRLGVRGNVVAAFAAPDTRWIPRGRLPTTRSTTSGSSSSCWPRRDGGSMTTRAGLEIDHVEIAAQDAAATTRLLIEAFGAVEQQPGRLLLGTAVLQLHQDASRRALSGLALRSDDLDGLRRRLSDAQVAFDDEDIPGAPGPAIRLRAQDWGGVPLVIGAWPPSDPRSTPADGDNVLGVDHIGIASDDNVVAERRLCDLLGLDVESRQTDTETVLRLEQFTSDTYGVRVATSQVGQTGLRVLFVSLGETDLELLQDLSVSAGGGGRSSSTAGDTTAISRYVQRSGPGLHHLALRVRDIDDALLRAKRAGATPLDKSGRPGSRHAQIAFIDPRSSARILFHFVQR